MYDHGVDECEYCIDHSHLKSKRDVEQVKVTGLDEDLEGLPEELSCAATLLLDGLQVTGWTLGQGTED